MMSQINLEPNEFFCSICYSKYNNSNKFIFLCKHYFCDNCVKDYFTLKITEGEIHLIKCLNSQCQNKPSIDLLESILNKTLVDKYNKFKKRKDILLDPNKIICCYKDCNSFAYLNKRSRVNVNKEEKSELERRDKGR